MGALFPVKAMYGFKVKLTPEELEDLIAYDDYTLRQDEIEDDAVDKFKSLQSKYLATLDRVIKELPGEIDSAYRQHHRSDKLYLRRIDENLYEEYDVAEGDVILGVGILSVPGEDDKDIALISRMRSLGATWFMWVEQGDD